MLASGSPHGCSARATSLRSFVDGTAPKPLPQQGQWRNGNFSTANSSESASAWYFIFDAKANLRLAPQPCGKEINKDSNGRDCHREADDKPDAYSLLRVHSRSLRRVRADCGVTTGIEELRRVRRIIAAAPTIQLRSGVGVEKVCRTERLFRLRCCSAEFFFSARLVGLAERVLWVG